MVKIGLLESIEHIVAKVEGFSKKYYTKVLIKGVLLFLTFASLLLLLVTGVEYWLWLSPTIRLILFFGFLLMLLVLAYRYIMVPMGYLFNIRKGIDQKKASQLIGKHFPNVGDRLVNLLELSKNKEKTDLLIAAIEQRSSELKPVAFSDAVDLKDGFSYGRYLIVPVLIFVLVWISGGIADFFNSYTRVVNYDLAYEPPAPFTFDLQNGELSVLEDKPLTLDVSINGKLVPESVFIGIGDDKMLMRATGPGRHQWTIEPPMRDFSFQFYANGVVSKAYHVKVVKVPAITDFKLKMQYPGYLQLSNDVVTGTGNVTVPEGTRITWQLEAINTSTINFVTKDTTVAFGASDDVFTHSKRVFSTTDYKLMTSNPNVSDYEQLGYRLNVIRDAVPTIHVEKQLDSLRPNESYFSGGVSDDNLVTRIDMVYYEQGATENVARLELLKPNTNVAQFYYTFPSGISVEEGRVYELYFEVVDNDGLRGGKSSRSQVFSTAILNNKQLNDRRLTMQDSLIHKLDKRFGEMELENDALKEINAQQKQNDDLGFREKEKVRQFLEQQRKQEELMQKFSKELRENLEKDAKEDEMGQLLQERLLRQEIAARKKQKLLEELGKVADKIEKEELKKRLEELAKSQNSGKRNLEQLLELTKRYYVTEKAAQLGRKLEELSKEQEKLAGHKKGAEQGKGEQQAKLNKEFDQISKELQGLKGDNRALKKPMDLNFTKNELESIKKDQQSALEELNNNSEAEKEKSVTKASQKQKSAADKMKELSKELQESMMGGGGGSNDVEDAGMLRQILDNLLTFSFKEEALMERVGKNSGELVEFSGTIKQQKELRQLFEHVDDSLFALSLRRAELSEFVNEQITEVYYNVDRTLESVADNKIYQAVSYQQYVLGASNALADFLAKVLDNMQASMMSGQGEGQGEGFQLPDIIKGQGDLKKKMDGDTGSGEDGEKGQGTKGANNKEGQGGEDDGSGKEGGNQQQSGGKGKNPGQDYGDDPSGKSRGAKDGTNDGEGNKGGVGGPDGNPNGTTTQGMSEEELKEVYEIYQEQQTIRRALEEQLNNMMDKGQRELARKLALQMEEFENELLQSGITERTRNKMNNIQHQMLKLENAAMEQGKKDSRESTTNQKDFSVPIITKPELFAPKHNDIEILNRQALPLRPEFQERVKAYFGNGD